MSWHGMTALTCASNISAIRSHRNLDTMKTIHILSTAALALAMVSTAIQPAAAASVSAPKSARLRPWQVAGLGPVARVTRVVDPQTLEVSISGGTAQTVRYAGVNTPAAGTCGYSQAYAATSDLMADALVILEPDVASVDRKYVYRIDGFQGGDELAAAGWARPDDSQPNSQHYFELVGTARGARESGLGGWNNCNWAGATKQVPASMPQTEPAAMNAAAAQSQSSTCTALSYDELTTRVDKLPEQAYLRNGDCITISGATDAQVNTWSGSYIYHPAGTTVKLANMYVRWRDGFVAITGNSDGTNDAHFVMNNIGEVARVFGPFKLIIVPGHDASTVRTLVRDVNSTDVIRIPDNAWLFRDAGNGKVTTFVDSFEYIRGDLRY